MRFRRVLYVSRGEPGDSAKSLINEPANPADFGNCCMNPQPCSTDLHENLQQRKISVWTAKIVGGSRGDPMRFHRLLCVSSENPYGSPKFLISELASPPGFWEQPADPLGKRVDPPEKHTEIIAIHVEILRCCMDPTGICWIRTAPRWSLGDSHRRAGASRMHRWRSPRNCGASIRNRRTTRSLVRLAIRRSRSRIGRNPRPQSHFPAAIAMRNVAAVAFSSSSWSGYFFSIASMRSSAAAASASRCWRCRTSA